MWLTTIRDVCIVMLLIMLNTTFGQRDAVLMHVLYQGATSYIKGVSFSVGLYKQFHRCLCNDTAKACTARFVRLGANPSVGSIEQLETRGDPPLSTLYSCTITTSDERLVCTKLQLPLTSGKLIVNCTSYQIPTINSCSFGCVTIAWSYAAERLYDAEGGLIDFQACQNHCYNITGITASPGGRTPSASIATRDTTDTPSQNKTTTPFGASQSSDDDAGVIVGVVISIILVIVLALIVIVLWRRRRQLKKSTKNNVNNALNNVMYANSAENEGSFHRHYLNIQSDLAKGSSGKYANESTDYKNIAGGSQFTSRPANNDNIGEYRNTGFDVTNIDGQYDYASVKNQESANGIAKNNQESSSVTDQRVDNGSVRSQEDVGYDLAKELGSNTNDVPNRYVSSTNNQQKLKLDNHFKNAAVDNLQLLLQKKNAQLAKNTKPNPNTDQRDNMGAEYDLATIAKEDMSNVAPDPSTTGTWTNSLIANSNANARADYGYSQIDNDYSAGRYNNVADKLSTHAADRSLNDYDYAEDTGPHDAVGAQLPDQSKTPAIVTDHVTDDGYNIVGSDSSSGQDEQNNVYSKCRHETTKMTNPYNVLRESGGNRTTKQDIENPASSLQSANQQPQYSLAQPFLTDSTSPIEIINVDPPSKRELRKQMDTPANNKNNSTVPIPNYSVVNKKRPNMEEQNPYFELEEEGDGIYEDDGSAA